MGLAGGRWGWQERGKAGRMEVGLAGWRWGWQDGGGAGRIEVGLAGWRCGWQEGGGTGGGRWGRGFEGMLLDCWRLPSFAVLSSNRSVCSHREAAHGCFRRCPRLAFMPSLSCWDTVCPRPDVLCSHLFVTLFSQC